ncbi:Lrp/AsnC family transcriptional regulator [Paeniglutamicibacter sp. NPDC012692]|uniref:Lrp/AsnC family transcriptional regulator n=1 Tax=Paeniglutamicibacter sp. NPDC012692 TaxID=3364388 RepID=UPI003685408F
MDGVQGSTGQIQAASDPGQAPLGGLSQAIRPVPDEEHFDAVDVALLQHLAADARQSQRTLARLVNMSAPAVGERIARLERVGVLQQYTVRVDWARLGYPMVVYLPVVAVTGTDIGLLMNSLTELAEVEDINVVSGSYDLLVRLRVRNHKHLTEILLNRIWQIPTLQRTETLLCLAESKQDSFTEKLLGQLHERLTN